MCDVEWLRWVDLEQMRALPALAGDDGAAAAGGRGCVGPSHGLGFLPVKVQTSDGREFLAFLDSGFSRLEIRLIAASSLLGRKARVAILDSDLGEVVVWGVLVLWTVRLPSGLFENGVALLDTSLVAPTGAET